ncbi:hypothetical protein ATANTOWER_025171 [Ataeniobius toweri]|uniref:Uncharacterized protein n=1 Tax=Ataeniobius toweri TaxID=208326 RepID=A0ABU7CKL0_9TELE|nr:hypothetical protein [Ataeniobius toweri]
MTRRMKPRGLLAASQISKPVAQVVGVCPVTSGLPVRTSAPSVSAIVSLGKTRHPPCLPMVFRGPSGADCMAASLECVDD